MLRTHICKKTHLMIINLKNVPSSHAGVGYKINDVVLAFIFYSQLQNYWPPS